MLIARLVSGKGTACIKLKPLDVRVHRPVGIERYSAYPLHALRHERPPTSLTVHLFINFVNATGLLESHQGDALTLAVSIGGMQGYIRHTACITEHLILNTVVPAR